MSELSPTVDRYISFSGIDCDQRARQLVDLVHQQIAILGQDAQWSGYFATKLAESERCRQDELHFIGSQVNALRELFALSCNQEGLALLEALEEECC